MCGRCAGKRRMARASALERPAIQAMSHFAAQRCPLRSDMSDDLVAAHICAWTEVHKFQCT